MSKKNSTQINTHKPNTKASNPYPRFVDGEYIAASVGEAQWAASQGWDVAPNRKSTAVRHNNGKEITPEHTAYMPMIVNELFNELRGVNVKPKSSSDMIFVEPQFFNDQNSLYGHTTTRTVPMQPPLGAFKSVPVTSSTIPVTSSTVVAPIISRTIPVTSSTIPMTSRTVPVTSSTIPVTSSTPPVKHQGVDDEQYQLDLVIAISLSESEPVPSAPPKDGDPIDVAIRLSMSCANCREPFKSATAKFCEECGSRR